jgi:hypothetical protein
MYIFQITIQFRTDTLMLLIVKKKSNVAEFKT